jgi:prolipoprotein diacylglyceryltransferase
MDVDDVVYFVSYQLAFVLFVVTTRRLLRGLRFRNAQTFVLALCYLSGMFFVAHGLYFVISGDLRNLGAENFWASVSEGAPLEKLLNIMSGLWGGPWIVVVLVAGYVAVTQLPVKDKRRIADACAVAFPFSLALAKVGCSAVGCCHGFAWEGSLALRNYDGVSCFPTQVLDLLAYLCVGAILAALHRRSHARGRLLVWFVVLFAIARFATETTRGDLLGSRIAGFTAVQMVVAVGLVIAFPLLAVPGLIERVLGWRTADWPTTDTAQMAANETSSGRSLVALVVSAFFSLPLLLFPIVYVVLLVFDNRHGELRRIGLRTLHTAGFVVGIFFVCAFFVPSLVVFALVFVAGAAVIALAIDGYFRRV